jgi:hypothetical protein
MAKSKIAQIDELIDGTSYFAHDPLAISCAARAARNALLRVLVEDRVAKAKKALKAFNIVVSVTVDDNGHRGVRFYAPTKQQELRFFA